MAEISRADAAALLNDQNSDEIFEAAAATSVALQTFRRVPMGTRRKRMPVIDVLPTAGFVGVGGASRVKPTSRVAWVNKVLEAEEIAVIVPIEEEVFDDSEFNVWGAVRPRVGEAVGATLDAAVLFGTGKPSTWPDSLEDGARAAGNVYSEATAGDLAEDLNQTMALVENDGFEPNQWFARIGLRSRLRGLRDSTGQPIYLGPSGIRDGGSVESVYGEPIAWSRNGAWVNATVGPPAAGATAIVGDREAAILGIRQDITFKILDEATLTDPVTRAVLISLAEEDMIALRVKIRVAFQIADPTTKEGGTAAFPFAVLGA